MITAQDIREKTFEKSTFGGYAMGEVDDFLDELADDLAAAQKESAVLKGKMKVLVEKIEEYRANEEAMKMALLSAQKMAREIESDSQSKADEVIAAAQAQADEIIAAAQAEADAITGDIKAKADAEELRYQKAKATATEYLQSMRLLAERQLGLLAGIEEAELTDAAIVTPAPAEKKALPQTLPTFEEEEEAEEEVEETPDYLKDFEQAVFQTVIDDEEFEEEDEEEYDEEEEEDEDDTDPMFRF